MDYFKHKSTSSDDEFINELIEKYGLSGYAWWFLLLELCHENWNGEGEPSFVFHTRIVRQKLRISQAKLELFLTFSQGFSKVSFGFFKNSLQISIPKMLEIRQTRKGFCKNSALNENENEKKNENKKENDVNTTDIVQDNASAPQNVEDIDRRRSFDLCGLNEKINLTNDELINITKTTKLTFKQVQESVEAFEWAMSSGKLKSVKKDLRSYFFGVVGRGREYLKADDYKPLALRIAEAKLAEKLEADRLESEQRKADFEKESRQKWDELPEFKKEIFIQKYLETLLHESYKRAAIENGTAEEGGFLEYLKTAAPTEPCRTYDKQMQKDIAPVFNGPMQEVTA